MLRDFFALGSARPDKMTGTPLGVLRSVAGLWLRPCPSTDGLCGNPRARRALRSVLFAGPLSSGHPALWRAFVSMSLRGQKDRHADTPRFHGDWRNGDMLPLCRPPPTAIKRLPPYANSETIGRSGPDGLCADAASRGVDEPLDHHNGSTNGSCR